MKTTLVIICFAAFIFYKLGKTAEVRRGVDDIIKRNINQLKK